MEKLRGRKHISVITSSFSFLRLIPSIFRQSSHEASIFHYDSNKLIFSCASFPSPPPQRRYRPRRRRGRGRRRRRLIRAIYTLYRHRQSAGIVRCIPSIFLPPLYLSPCLPLSTLVLPRCKGNLKSSPPALMNPLCPEIVLIRLQRQAPLALPCTPTRAPGVVLLL